MRTKAALTIAGALVVGLAPSVASSAVDRSLTAAVALGTSADAPPRPFMRTHDVRIRAARIGYCPSTDPCVLPDVFKTTRPLPVHRHAHVFVNTRVKAAKVRVDLFCGKEGPVWQLGPRRWVFHANRRHAERERCNGGSLSIRYAQGTDFEGNALFTFSTKPHRH
jgi:hypothetical protein